MAHSSETPPKSAASWRRLPSHGSLVPRSSQCHRATAPGMIATQNSTKKSIIATPTSGIQLKKGIHPHHGAPRYSAPRFPTAHAAARGSRISTTTRAPSPIHSHVLRSVTHAPIYYTLIVVVPSQGLGGPCSRTRGARAGSVPEGSRRQRKCTRHEDWEGWEIDR